MLMLMTWLGVDRRLQQSPYTGPDRRNPRHGESNYGDAPARLPEGPRGDWPHDGFGAWLRQWLAPQALIALVAFAGMTSVAHYRLSEVEREVATIRADMTREVAAMRADMAAAYARRDVLSEQLSTINMRLSGIERALRVNGRGPTER